MRCWKRHIDESEKHTPSVMRLEVKRLDERHSSKLNNIGQRTQAMRSFISQLANRLLFWKPS